MREIIAGTKQVLLDFPSNGLGSGDTSVHSQRTLATVVDRPFLPMGILLWGVTKDSYVTRLRVGNLSEGSVSGEGRIPAELFATERALTELRRLAERGELPGAIDPRAVLEMEAAAIGTCVSLETTGPLRAACLWGLTYTDGYPYSEVVVEQFPTPERETGQRDPPESYRGVIREHTLGGQRDRARVTCPTLESATALLTAMLRQKDRW